MKLAFTRDRGEAPILLFKNFGNKSILIATVLIITILVLDAALERISDLLLLGADSSISGMSIRLFIVISVTAYGIGQYVVLSFINYRNKHILNTTDVNRRKNRFVLTHRLVLLAQYTLTAALTSVILLIILESYYYTNQLILSTVISYALSIFLLSLLSNRFFSWYRSNRNLVVLSYGFACAMLAVNLSLNMSFMVSALLNQSPQIMPRVTVASASFSPDSPMGMLYSSSVIFGIISFLSMWTSTALLLRHHSTRLGRVKFWIVISIPLIYFLTPFVPSLVSQIAAPLLRSNPIYGAVLLTLIFAISKPAGGILFGVAFWTVAMAVRESSIVRDYMIMSALGVVTLFVATQGTVINAYYPPFGLVTVSYVGLSTFMMVIGLYSSAISVSEDEKLRKTIRKNALQESKLLDSIGTAQMGQEIERKVMQIEKRVIEMAKEDAEELEIESGVKPSLEEPDMKKYLEEVMQEVSLSIKSKQPRPSS